MVTPKRAVLAAALTIVLALSGCGLGRDSASDRQGGSDPLIAATVNGRPIYREDVLNYAVAMGMLQEGEDVSGDSQAYYEARDQLIERRLFALEAEARGLDRDPTIRRQIELARDAVLWAAIAAEIDEAANDSAAIERLYRENQRNLGGGEEVSVRHIQFPTREAAEAARRRIVDGERFEMLAFELSLDRESAADGGLLSWGNVNDLTPAFRRAVDGATIGALIGPFEQNGQWHLMRLEDRRSVGGPSLESLRPQIVNWLRWEENMRLRSRLEETARIEIFGETEVGVEGGGEVTAPDDAAPPTPAAPQPRAPRAGGQTPPPFPFPTGPGAVASEPAPAAPAPAQEQPPAAAEDAAGPS